jgi:CDGSH-type Zn-finger protein/uncharacterized Fe-S cluster protein YjdI
MSTDSGQTVYEGTHLDATWDGRLCIHVGECTRARGKIFASGRDRWGQPDREEPETVVAVIERCPTGALTYGRKDGGAGETPPGENTVMVANHGPLYVRGDLRIVGAADDMPGVVFRAALCRCGKSARKPFCDNSHEGAGFRDHGPIGDTGAPVVEAGGPLAITPLKDGPLVIEGNVTLVSGHGKRTWQGTKTVLCRCGESANKPFCDGTHVLVDFTAD